MSLTKFKAMWRRERYADDADSEAAQPLTGEKEVEQCSAERQHTSQKPDRRMLYANIIFFMFSCSILFRSWILDLVPGMAPRNSLLRKTSSPSPLFDLLDIPLSTKQMNGTLMPTQPVPIYRQPPSAEVDAAWDRISTRDPVVMDKSDVLAMNKDPADAAQWPDNWFGPDKYIGKVDVFHQIHCLDRIRRSLYWNFEHYYGEDFPPGTPVNHMHTYHVDHCVYILLQNIQCHADLEVYTSKWVDAQTHPYPDFMIEKKCRDFDAILDWQEKNSVPMEEALKVRPRPDSQIHVMNHEFKQLVRWYEDHPDDHVVGGEIG